MKTEFYVEAQLARFRDGDEDGAFHALRDLPDIVAILTNEFRVETDPLTKAFLVRVLWESRDPAVLPVLSDALADHSSKVWNEALNGLVTLASDESLDVLRRAHSHPAHNRQAQVVFPSRVHEAIEQVEEVLRKPNANE